jgi:hypothetical protein
VAAGRYDYNHFWRVLASVADARAERRCLRWTRS